MNQYVAILETENKIKLLENFKGAKKHHKMQCLVCNHEWIATPVSKRQTFKKHGVGGCPNCNNKKKERKFVRIRENRLQELKKRGIVVLDEDYDGRLRLDHSQPLRLEKILVKNINCGHTFEVTPLNLIQSEVECGICGPRKRVEKLTQWSKQNSQKWQETATDWQLYKSNVSALTRTAYHQHHKTINPKNLPRGKAGIEGAHHLDHKVPIRFCFENNIPPEVCAHYTNLQMIGWRENVGSRNHLKGALPLLFMKYVPQNTITTHALNQIQQMFPLATPYKQIGDVTVSLYDERSNHAVLILPLDETQANTKTAKSVVDTLTAHSINYSIVFQDELHDLDRIQNKIKHYTNQNTSTKIHGRSCKIKPIDKTQKRDFLDEYHIQGNDRGQINYGAFYEDILVAVMTFCAPRIALGYKKDRSKYKHIWELSRFATHTEYRVPGIASKLLKHFQRNNEWREIFSYADRRWSIGNLYYRLGFELTRTTPPDYFYIIDGQRKHRWNYRKDILKKTLPNYDPELTEYQNMQNHGFFRVWDAGTLRFSLKK